MSRSYSPRSSSRSSSSSRSRSSSSRSSSRSSSSSGSRRANGATSVPPPPPPLSSPYRYRPSRTVYHTYTPPTYQPAPTVVLTPPSATEEAFHNGLWAGRLESATLLGGAAYLHHAFLKGEGEGEGDGDADDVYASDLAATRELMSELEREFDKTDSVVSAIQRPASGKYVGTTAEDDGGDQGVFTHLIFGDDGNVRGWGDDAEDGTYVIKAGRWHSDPARLGGARAAWIEQYDDGFEVALRAQIRDDGTILGMWASSRGVAGSVELVASKKQGDD